MFETPEDLAKREHQYNVCKQELRDSYASNHEQFDAELSMVTLMLKVTGHNMAVRALALAGMMLMLEYHRDKIEKGARNEETKDRKGLDNKGWV